MWPPPSACFELLPPPLAGLELTPAPLAKCELPPPVLAGCGLRNDCASFASRRISDLTSCRA
eukprot:scaffold13320_cov118-Isochrysis_galbana.AAC.7